MTTLGKRYDHGEEMNQEYVDQDVADEVSEEAAKLSLQLQLLPYNEL